VHFFKPPQGCDGASGGCLLKFKVFDYSTKYPYYDAGNTRYPGVDDYNLGDLGKSKAVIKVYGGDEAGGGLRATYTIPESVGKSLSYYTVFTYDASTDTLVEGDVHMCPWISKQLTKSWSWQMDYEGWAELSSWDNGLITGLERMERKGGLSDTTYVHYNKLASAGKYSWEKTPVSCEDHDIELSPEGGSVSCQALSGNGFFFRGFFRQGSKYSDDGTSQLVKVKCCKPDELADAGYGECHKHEVGKFTSGTPAKCPGTSFWVGLETKGDLLEDLSSMECCEFPSKGCEKTW